MPAPDDAGTPRKVHLCTTRSSCLHPRDQDETMKELRRVEAIERLHVLGFPTRTDILDWAKQAL